MWCLKRISLEDALRTELNSHEIETLFYHLNRLRTYPDQLFGYVKANIGLIFKHLPSVYHFLPTEYSLKDLLEIYFDSKISIYQKPKYLLQWADLIKENVSKNFLRNRLNQWLATYGQRFSYHDLSQLMAYANDWRDLIRKDLFGLLTFLSLKSSSDYPVYHFMDWTQVPENLRQAAEEKYFEKPYEQLRATSFLTPVSRQNVHIGKCFKAQEGHLKTLARSFWMIDSDYGSTIIIREKGQALFALKKIGDPSLLALRSIRLSQNRMAIIRGVVYAPPKELIMGLKRKKLFEPHFRFAVHDLTKALSVKPLAWVDHTDNVHWSKRFTRKFLKKLSTTAEKYSD